MSGAKSCSVRLNKVFLDQPLYGWDGSADEDGLLPTLAGSPMYEADRTLAMSHMGDYGLIVSLINLDWGEATGWQVELVKDVGALAGVEVRAPC